MTRLDDSTHLEVGLVGVRDRVAVVALLEALGHPAHRPGPEPSEHGGLSGVAREADSGSSSNGREESWRPEKMKNEQNETSFCMTSNT